MGMTSTKVEIPADVRDNSETVTDYAHTGHRSHDKGVRTPQERNAALAYALPEDRAYDIHTWYDVNPDGQRCRFDMITQDDGRVVHLFHTEYFTRVKCADCEYSWSAVFQVVRVTGPGGEFEDSEAAARCDYHADVMRKNCAGLSSVRLLESEPLRIGQH